MLALLCVFAAISIRDPENTSFLNIMITIPGVAFSFKCLVQNSDETFPTVSLLVGFWLFLALALLNKYVFEVEESYLTVRLVILGALGARAYQNVFNENLRTTSIVFRSKVKSELSFVGRSAVISSVRENATPKTPYTRHENANAPRYRQGCATFQLTIPEQPSMYGNASLKKKISSDEFHSRVCSRAKSLNDDSPVLKCTSPTTVLYSCRGEIRGDSTEGSSQQKNRNPSRTVNVSYGDIITNPMCTVCFCRDDKLRKLVVTNLSTETIMWALKTDATCILNATPTRGVLYHGQQQSIILFAAYHKQEIGSGRSSRVHSHIAIDYVFVQPWTLWFDKTVFESRENKRHILQAVFDQ